MKMTDNTILITGGTSGIGLALAKRFLALGNTVIVSGRNSEKLKAAETLGLKTLQADVSSEVERLNFVETALAQFPKINVLFNNAGLMNGGELTDPLTWDKLEQEIETNLKAPIHLSMLFAAHLKTQQSAVILNTTSGLAHVPLIPAAGYCVTKAGLNSFTITLREQFRPLGIEVIEVSPPHVNTDIGAPGRNEAGMPLDEYADAVIVGLQAGKPEVTVGFSELTSAASRSEREQLFKQMNAQFATV